MAKFVKIMFDGVEKECLVQVDQNKEYVCIARDGQFVKFAAAADGEDADKYLTSQVDAHNADTSNIIVPVSGEAEAQKKAELDDWLTDEAKAQRTST
jgi:hypothetical protein